MISQSPEHDACGRSEPVDPFAKEYMRMILSREGQAILAAQKDTEEGYVLLAPKLIPEELKKLE